METQAQQFIKDFDKVNDWVNSMRPHWTHLEGDVHNDSTFWRQCIHSIKPDVWLAWANIYGELNQASPGAFAKHTYIYEDTVTIVSRIEQGEAISKPYNKQGYNKPVFRAVMAIKDIIADISNRPFETKNTAKKRTKPSKAEVLEKINQLQAMVEDLFE